MGSDVLLASNGRLYEVWASHRRLLDVQRTSDGVQGQGVQKCRRLK